MSPFCASEQINIFLQVIDILRWIVELGRVDVQLEVTKLLSFLAALRIGHMHQAFHIFKYLKNHNNFWISLDSSKVYVEWKGLHERSPDARRAMMKKVC